jgi:membrane associated rhomboid family serine protease
MDWLLPIIGFTIWASYRGFKLPEFREKWLLIPYLVKDDRQWYRMLSHGFIHANTSHLFLNLFVLWQFGSGVEDAFSAGELDSPVWGLSGNWTFPILYFGALLAASIPAILKHGENPNYASLGASGAVSAVLMAYILLYPTHTLLLFFVIPMPAALAGVLFLVYESYMNRKKRTGIAHDAHLMGAIFGIAFVFLFDTAVVEDAFYAIQQSLLGSY